DAAGDNVGSGGVDHAKVLINGIDRAEHAPLPVAGQTTHDCAKNTLPAAALRQIEARKHERRDRNPDRGASCQGLTRLQRNKGKKAEDREQKLCCGLDEDVDDHAGRRERAWNGVNVSKPAPMRSPPTCASGNRTLVASRTN